MATVEEHLGGTATDGHDPAARTTMAVGLHRLVEAAAPLQAEVGRALVLRPDGAPMWPEPHSLRFDFEATSVGAEWIDRHFAAAQRRLRPTRGGDQNRSLRLAGPELGLS